jgi:hypothetical protein
MGEKTLYILDVRRASRDYTENRASQPVRLPIDSLWDLRRGGEGDKDQRRESV